jgi:hypothetical protein
LKNLSIDGKIMLKYTVKKQDVGHGLNLSVSEWGSVLDTCEYHNEFMGSIKHAEFLE